MAIGFRTVMLQIMPERKSVILLSTNIHAFIISKTPAGRWGKPDDLIGPAVFLASDASNFVNGQILYVDGGILAYLGRMPEQGA